MIENQNTGLLIQVACSIEVATKTGFTVFYSKKCCSFPGLLDLANAYCEPILKKQCEQIIRHGITVQNVAMLYAASIKFEAKVRIHSDYF